MDTIVGERLGLQLPSRYTTESTRDLGVARLLIGVAAPLLRTRIPGVGLSERRGPTEADVSLAEGVEGTVTIGGGVTARRAGAGRLVLEATVEAQTAVRGANDRGVVELLAVCTLSYPGERLSEGVNGICANSLCASCCMCCCCACCWSEGGCGEEDR